MNDAMNELEQLTFFTHIMEAQIKALLKTLSADQIELYNSTLTENIKAIKASNPLGVPLEKVAQTLQVQI